MYEVGIVAGFEAAHSLRGDFGPATNLHGHTYRVEISVKGPELTPDGVLCDIGPLQQGLDRVLGLLHYRNLDEVVELAGLNTTAEVMATFIHDELRRNLDLSQTAWLRVAVWESGHAFAAYEAPPR